MGVLLLQKVMNNAGRSDGDLEELKCICCTGLLRRAART